MTDDQAALADETPVQRYAHEFFPEPGSTGSAREFRNYHAARAFAFMLGWEECAPEHKRGYLHSWIGESHAAILIGYTLDESTPRTSIALEAHLDMEDAGAAQERIYEWLTDADMDLDLMRSYCDPKHLAAA